MRRRQSVFLTIIMVAGTLSGSASAQLRHTTELHAASAITVPAPTVNQVIDRITAREHDEVSIIRQYSPINETYLQEIKSDKQMGVKPARDYYFLGQARLSNNAVDDSMLNPQKSKTDALNPIAHLSAYLSPSYDPSRFLSMIFVDTAGFDRQHYQFDYVRDEFVGEVRCAVFDVTPLPHSGNGRFVGRIWAEDQNYTIVRFNGVYAPMGGTSGTGFNLHFDSWRMNLQPGLWLPAFVFSQESDLKDFRGKDIRFKSQTRFWGYDLKNADEPEEFGELTIESPFAVDQSAAAQRDRSPLEAERDWEHEAEVNVIDRLQRTGLVAPPGEVDKVLETVVNNLEVTNNLDIEPGVRCRVLLTGTLESFSIGHTIVLSRGLLDVLPDEATLATMLAQELANIIVMKPSTDQWGFNDTTNVSTIQVLNRFSFRDSPNQAQMANQKALELLKNSPYKDKLSAPGLFLKQLDEESKSLQALINPHIGNRVFLHTQLVNSAPTLQPDKLDQIAALPIGARIKIDPWSDQVQLLKAKPIALLSAREKMPFEVTPFMPFLTRYQSMNSTASSNPAAAELLRNSTDGSHN